MSSKLLWFILVSFITILSADAQDCEALFSFDNTGITIQFTDESTSPGNDPIISWFWDFDDGTTSTEQNPIHTFPNPDVYRVILTISTQNNCVSEIEIEIEICALNSTVEVDPCVGDIVTLTINVTDIYDNADEINISLDGELIPGGPWSIDAENPVTINIDILGDGLVHELIVQSTNVGTCNNTQLISVPDCGTDCFLSSLAVNIIAGSTHIIDIGDNFFSPVSTTLIIGDVARFEWIGDGHSSTSDATTGTDSWNSGVIGVGSFYEVSLINPGVHPFYCIPHGGPGGAGMSGTLVANCPDGNNFTLDITFNTTTSNPQGYNILIDGILDPGSPFTYIGTGPQNANIDISGDGLNHIIEIQDIADPLCIISRDFLSPDCGAQPACSLSLTAIENGPCDNNNEVSIDLTVTSVNPGSSGFNVLVDGVNIGNYPYNPSNITMVSINIVGDGLSHLIEINDNDDSACTTNNSIITTNCTIPCSITNISATSGSSTTHSVNVEDFQFNPANIVIISGDIVEWNWIGDVEHTSTSDATTGPDSWDSGLMGLGASYQSPVLTTGLHPYYCIPHGAPNGVGMSGTITVQADCTNGNVSVLVTFNEVGGGFSGYNVLVDGNLDPGSPYTYDVTGINSISIFTPGDGLDHSIEIQDIDDPTCTALINLTTPDCNASTCQISATAFETGPCDNNNEVLVDIEITDVGGGATGFNLTLDGNSQGNFLYDASGITIVQILVAGDALEHLIVISDLEDLDCSVQTSITTANCTIPCSLTNLSATTGSSAIHIVNVEDFQFSPADIVITSGDIVEWNWVGDVAHTSTSDVLTGADSWNSGLLSLGESYQSPVLSPGLHQYYCIPHGAPNGVGMSGTISVQADCTEGNVIVQTSFNETGGGFSGYNVIVDGNVVPNGPFTYDITGNNLISISTPGDGMEHSIAIQDIDDPTCIIQTNIITPDCNAGSCLLTISGVQIGDCDDQNIQSVNLSIEDIMGGEEGFNVYIDDVLESSGNYDVSGITPIEVLVTGDGIEHIIKVIDIANATCKDSTIIISSDCSIECTISEVNVSFGTNARHLVEVKDFEFFPKDLTINVGDTVLFNWTGVIPHSVTSDEPIGPNSFNSGIQVEGYQYELIIDSEGHHPYYCIPHGSPGGIGMSGSITTLTDCNGGDVLAQITFLNSGGSNAGFNILVDNIIQNGSPYNYSASEIQELSISISGDGLPHQLKVQDVSFDNCSNSSDFISPDCISDACEILITNNILSDCDESEVNVQIDFTAANQGTYYNIFLDGTLYNQVPLEYSSDGNNSTSLLVSGNGNLRNIVIIDSQDFSCSDTIEVEVPQCGDPCLISNFNVDNVPGLHIVEVRDFEFYPKDLETILGDTVRFVWKGEIEHTSTSDIATGLSNWDSGLLGNGQSFDLIIPEAGLHPYYCIPHGGPGGIGMSGTISVQDSCNGETWNTNFNFEIQNGSPLGYNLFIDGVQTNDTPIQYQNQNGLNEYPIGIQGDGNLHTITIQDLETDFCASSIIVESPICGAGCAILELTVNTASQIVNVIEVRDFEFFPKVIDVKVGETVRFVWTGTIPHTSTSDKLSGPDSWNSELFGQGGEFDIVFFTPGEHPYYCIPHGGPGGIGMSGLINVSPKCSDGLVDVQIQFTSTNGSNEGYNLFIDGNPYNDELIQYQNNSGLNNLNIQIPGDNKNHIATIQDFINPICAASTLFIAPSCGTDCRFSGLEINFEKNVTHLIEVRDFEFVPKNIKVERGDTLRFVWTGDIPHTVTSDSISGDVVFNSGLFGNGAVYELIINHEGSHPYYCIPHGSPGGIGMSGVIEVVSPCEDGILLVEASFISENNGTGYNVFIDNIPFEINPIPYSNSLKQSFQFETNGNGIEHNLQIFDFIDSNCSIGSLFTSPDCNDPCYDTNSSFEYEKQTNSKEVKFFDRSLGDVDSWSWDFADGNFSTEQNPIHSYEEDGSYIVCLTVSTIENECSKTYCDKVNIGGFQCEVAFDFEIDGLNVQFNNNSQVSNPDSEFQWEFGDEVGTSGQINPLYSYDIPGIYIVCLTITSDSCNQSICNEVDISNACLTFDAEFNFSQDEENPLLLQFEDQSQGNVDNWLWGFGDGITSDEQNPSHIFEEEGFYNICLLVQDTLNNCNSSICRNIMVGTTSTINHPGEIGQLDIFPIPALKSESHWTVTGLDQEGELKELNYQILDTNGKTLKTNYVGNSSQVKIPIPLLSGGIYILRIYGKKKVYQGMVILQ